MTDSDHAEGRVAFGGWGNPRFDNLKIGYDNNADDDIDDAGDDVVVDESFGGTSVTVAHDHAGNLIDDGKLVYVYDAWNRLVKVRARADADLAIQEAEYDGTGRRIRKIVTNSGDFNGTFVYIYDGWKIAQVNDGSGNMVQQFIHGTQYIDELVMMRAAGRGDLYVHQDANWNVIALTDLGGSVVERYTYTPYGELTVHQVTGYGDRDGDGTVDATDKGTPGTTCTGTVSGACRILDLDFDGDYDSADATLFDSLPQGLGRHPGRTSTAVRQIFGHIGLLFDAEIGSYYNRFRAYLASPSRYLQRDPLALMAAKRRSKPPDGSNLYWYLSTNPMSRVDPMGLIACNVPCCQYIERCHLCCGTRCRYTTDWGLVMCCCNQKFTCVCDDNIPWPDSEIRDCMVLHEETHLPDIECAECSGCERPPFTNPANQFPAECAAWWATMACAQEVLSQCAVNHMSCPGMEDFIIEIIFNLQYWCP